MSTLFPRKSYLCLLQPLTSCYINTHTPQSAASVAPTLRAHASLPPAARSSPSTSLLSRPPPAPTVCSSVDPSKHARSTSTSARHPAHPARARSPTVFFFHFLSMYISLPLLCFSFGLCLSVLCLWMSGPRGLQAGGSHRRRDSPELTLTVCVQFVSTTSTRVANSSRRVARGSPVASVSNFFGYITVLLGETCVRVCVLERVMRFWSRCVVWHCRWCECDEGVGERDESLDVRDKMHALRARTSEYTHLTRCILVFGLQLLASEALRYYCCTLALLMANLSSSL